MHELWALLNFLFPEIFISSSVFDKGFSLQGADGSAVIDMSLVKAAHALLQPLMLRRLKANVQLELPPKTETKAHYSLSSALYLHEQVFVGLSQLQRHFYRRLLEANSGVLMTGCCDNCC